MPGGAAAKVAVIAGAGVTVIVVEQPDVPVHVLEHAVVVEQSSVVYEAESMVMVSH